MRPDIRLTIAAPALASYLQGGGHWSWMLQYLFGLRDLCVEVFLVTLLKQNDDHEITERKLYDFFRLLSEYGFADRSRVILYRDWQRLDAGEYDVFPNSAPLIQEIISTSDAVWDFAQCMPGTLVRQFKRRILVDGDPGHLQVSLLVCEESLDQYDVFMTVGRNIGAPGCEVPTLGKNWHSYFQVVYLPFWPVQPFPPNKAPLSSISHWNFGELHWDERVLSISKRDAYLKYILVAERLALPVELATPLGDNFYAPDRELLEAHHWRLADSYKVAGSVENYRRYIQNSFAEICCAKPIYCILRTGWQSDRSAAYLASGRPVLMEDTGLSNCLNPGKGLLFFSDLDSLLSATEAVLGDYATHSKAAREIAEAYFATSRVLPRLLDLTLS